MNMVGKFRVWLAISMVVIVCLLVFSGRVASGDQTAVPGFMISFLAFGVAAPVTIYYNQRRQGNHASFREAQFLEGITRSLKKEDDHDKAKNSKI